MEKKKSNVVNLIALVVVLAIIVIARFVTTPDSVQESIWSLLPPVIAISLALITKEVYSSLFCGILVGGLLYSGYTLQGTVNHIFIDGMVGTYAEDDNVVAGVLTDPYNMGIIIFLVILGAMVALMNKAGGSAAFGKWASEHIKSRVGAQLATIGLGILIFVDDYFNCLTVGSVMRPVTDKFQVSRAKLAYLIDSTAAPICIIAPISSWAAAVSGFVEGENGLSLFVRAIPYNFYALLTVAMMVFLVIFKSDYGPMATHEKNALNGDLFTTKDEGMQLDSRDFGESRGTVLDLVIPVLALVVCCVIGMIWTGGFFEGKGFVKAFSESDASIGLAVGSFFAFLITLVFYIVRKVLSFEEFMGCVPQGFKAMVPAILILTFAWTLKSMTDSLGAKVFVENLIKNNAASFSWALPAIIFAIAVGLAFATGTSWGTFGILIPIVVGAFQATDPDLMLVAISACMAGAVCGDHCSPISDTTIMASAGAMCNHVNHVSTQLPYALTVAAISFVTYLVAGITKSWVISLPVGVVILLALMFVLKGRVGGDGTQAKAPEEAEA